MQIRTPPPHPSFPRTPLSPRLETAANEIAAYDSERGGDARRLVVSGRRVRALAETWGVGRVLEPLAIRELLDNVRNNGGTDETAM